MSWKTFYVLTAVSVIAIPGFSAQERVLRVENRVRVGYDDNVYLQNDKEGSGFLTDIAQLSGTFHISGRTDALIYWQPEVRYRFDADPKTITYQDLYANLNHAVSQRAFLRLSDRVRYQQKDAQSGSGVSKFDQNYLENDLNGSLDIDVDSLSLVKLGGGYELRRWEDSSYGSGTMQNDFDRYLANLSYQRVLKPNKTTGVLSANYVNHEYDGSRGGYDAWSLLGGVDQNFNPNLTGFGRAGFSVASIDTEMGSNNNTTPYAEAGLSYNPTARTSINGSAGYSIAYSENSVYNAQDKLNLNLGVKHDLTAKISVAGSVAYIYSQYKSDYAKTVNPDVQDNFMQISLRGSYQINRNNFVEAGYEYSDRWNDGSVFTEYDRNRVDIGWRLRL